MNQECHIHYKESPVALLFSMEAAESPPPLHHPDNLLQGAIESTLSGAITARCGNCMAAEQKTLIVKMAQKITRTSLPSLYMIYKIHCLRKGTSIVTDTTHPFHVLFTLLSLGKRYQSKTAFISRIKL